MVGCAAEGNFMSPSLIDRFGISVKKKDQAYDLIAIDGNPLLEQDGRVTRETLTLLMLIERHYEEISFDILAMARHNVVLGLLWLHQHNPLIDWRRRVLSFGRCNCVTTSQPMRRQRSTIDEKTRPRRNLAALTKDHTHKSDSTDTSTDQPGQQVRGSRLNAPTEYHELARIAKGPLKDIPAIYSKWDPLFREVEAESALPQHQPWDHVINI